MSLVAVLAVLVGYGAVGAGAVVEIGAWVLVPWGLILMLVGLFVLPAERSK